MEKSTQPIIGKNQNHPEKRHSRNSSSRLPRKWRKPAWKDATLITTHKKNSNPKSYGQKYRKPYAMQIRYFWTFY